jgi:hypothetical protein
MRAVALVVMLAAASSFADEGVAEIFVDRGETYVRAGTAQGLKVGSEIAIVGPTIGGGTERRAFGSATVLEVWEKLARVSLNAAAKAEKGEKFAQVAGATAAKGPSAKPAELSKPPDAPQADATPSLKGRASSSGAGKLRRITVYNDGNTLWTNCDVRLPNNKHYVVPKLAGGASEGIMFFRFEQDGVAYDKPVDSVLVKCHEGTSRFRFSF